MTASTLLQAVQYFSDEARCIKYVADQRWPDGKVVCPTCGRDDVSFMASRNVWQCKSAHPKRAFSVKVGTIFEDSPVPLSKWLPAVWLLASAKNGISSYELGRAVGVTQKTAWFMLQRIRLAMQDGDGTMMGGTVEVDETFIGGKARFMHAAQRRKKIHGTGGRDKTAVIGLLERHGPDGHSRVRLDVVESRRRKSLSGRVRKNVKAGSSVYTDAFKSYNDLSKDFVHGFIDHAEKYVDGVVHTNGIENFWSLLKRSLKGTYVSVEPFHLFRYLDEQALRFNTREVSDSARMAQVVGSIAGRRLTYRELTSS